MIHTIDQFRNLNEVVQWSKVLARSAISCNFDRDRLFYEFTDSVSYFKLQNFFFAYKESRTTSNGIKALDLEAIFFQWTIKTSKLFKVPKWVLIENINHVWLSSDNPNCSVTFCGTQQCLRTFTHNLCLIWCFDASCRNHRQTKEATVCWL